MYSTAFDGVFKYPGWVTCIFDYLYAHISIIIQKKNRSDRVVPCRDKTSLCEMGVSRLYRYFRSTMTSAMVFGEMELCGEMT